MSSENSFIMVNLALMKGLKLSFIEAGLIERIRYFAEFDSKGSGWCYVGKQRLADELGLSKQGLYKAIDRLIDRKLLIKNDKGWIKVNLDGVNSVDSQLSLPVNSVYSRSQLSLPNNILEEDNSNISNIDSNSKLLLGQLSLPVNKVDSKQSLPKKPKRQKLIMTDDEYGRMKIANGFECYGEFENVFLTDKEMNRAKEKVGTLLLKEAINQLSAWKEDSGQPLCEHISDIAKMHKWVFDKARQILDRQGVDYKGAHARELGFNKPKEINGTT